MRIFNFGSLNFDHIYRVNHLVQPGETISSEDYCLNMGGKGFNQSVAAAKAGCEVWHIGKIGPDGKQFKTFLQSLDVNTDYISESKFQTGHTVIQVDRKGQNSIILYNGANFDVDPAFIDCAGQNLHSEDIVLLQNEISHNAYIMESAHRRGVRIAFNPSPITEGIFRLPLQYVKWFLINEIEGAELTGESEPENIADQLLQKFPSSSVILTLGRKGVLYKDAEREIKHGVYQVKRVDTTGAGDTFTGYFIAGIAQNLPLAEIIRRASIASSITVSRRGTSSSIPTLDEVLTTKFELC
jgi:ribokinase